MPEPYFPPGATPEQCRRIVAACARMLEPPKGKSKGDEASKALKPSRQPEEKPKARKP
jgi:hypothetical protein